MQLQLDIFIAARDVVSGQILKALAVMSQGKQKKDHRNRIIINDMVAFSVPSRVLFLWMVVQAESLESVKTRPNPYNYIEFHSANLKIFDLFWFSQTLPLKCYGQHLSVKYYRL